ncbi:hypothetical protein J2X68_001021 [Streptomyces sp. 3330]|nr:hypothetical protein [Streptomyces sp. 3330]
MEIAGLGGPESPELGLQDWRTVLDARQPSDGKNAP